VRTPEPPTRGRVLTLLATLVLAVAAAAPAAAQEQDLTVLAGLGFGGEFKDAASGETRQADEALSLGLALGFRLGNGRTLEVVWTHQELQVPPTTYGGAVVDLGLDSLGVGGTYEWAGGAVQPFVSGTAGLTVLSPEAGYDLEVLLSATLGGGVRIPVSPRVGVRLEARGALMLATGSAAGVCGGGGCLLTFSGAGLARLELLAGLAVAF
jgi:hypothetical protein